MYDGVQFRSRLEARWAAFFDLLTWDWLYEPVDLNGWIPDFSIFGHVLVEVKPCIEQKDLEIHTKRIEDSGYSGSALLVGANVFVQEDRNFGPRANLGIHKDSDWWSDDGYVATCDDCGKLSYSSAYGGYGCWRNGCYDGNPMCSNPDLDVARVQNLWKRAGNLTQWKGVQSRPNRPEPSRGIPIDLARYCPALLLAQEP